jgi:arginine:ornithine antiporter/lysine permease
VWLVYAAGLNYLLLTVLLYTPAIVVYVLMQIKNREKIFTAKEMVVATILIALCAFCLYRVMTGQLTVI